MLHVLERFVIHFFSACSLVLIVFFLLAYWQRRNHKAALWLPDERPLLVMSGLVVFALAALREPIDVAMGQSVVKAITDFVSWATGAGIGVWALYRFRLT